MTHREPQSEPRQLGLLACMLLCYGGVTWCPVAVAEPDLSDPDAAVSAGREALRGSPAIPWYDPETDSLRPADVELPRAPRPTSQFSLTFMEVMMWLGWMLLIMLLLVLVYLIMKVFLNREVQGSIEIEREAVGADIVRVEELPVALEKSPEDYLDEAQRLYRKGDLAQAIVYLFSHQLLQLDRRHWLRLVKGKTNRQYLREVRRRGTPESGELADMFERTVLLFEEVFFGKRLPPRERIDAAWNQIDRFETLVVVMEQQAA